MESFLTGSFITSVSTRTATFLPTLLTGALNTGFHRDKHHEYGISICTCIAELNKYMGAKVCVYCTPVFIVGFLDSSGSSSGGVELGQFQVHLRPSSERRERP